MGFSVYLDGVMLPVAPPKLTLKIGGNNEVKTLINGEDINIIRSLKLTEISFEALLPNTQYPFAVYPDGFNRADFYIAKLEELKKRKTPFRFVVTRELPNGETLFDTGSLTGDEMLVTLEEYSLKEEAENGFDVVADISLKQYRPYGTSLTPIKVTVNAEGEAEAAPAVERAVAKEPPRTYTVVSGDSLWSICKRELGDGSRCYAIAELNGISNPNLIYPGQVIRFE